MRRVILQILPVDDESAGNFIAESKSMNFDADEDRERQCLQVEAVISADQVRSVLEMLLDPDATRDFSTSDRIVEMLVRQELAAGEEGQLFDHVISNVERALLARTYEECDHVQTRTADRLGVNRNTIHKKLRKYALIRSTEGDEHGEPSSFDPAAAASAPDPVREAEAI